MTQRAEDQRETRERVVVVGGSSGIGEATAAAFLRRNAEVTIVGRDRARLAAAKARLGDVRAVEVDGADARGAARLFEGVGPHHHLVLALSGGKGAGPLASLSLDDLRSGLEGKLFAQLTTLQAALPHVKASVTLVSAISARAAMPGTAGLAAINGAIEAMVRPLAAELAPLRVNAVSPGIIDTPWWDVMPAEAKESYFRRAAETLPARRVGAASDVAEAIVMIARNPYVTGTVLEVDGGAHLARG
jgi:NAD(P)-dependent dehydrogenase (short-subunit alcohol dehydrogenase family)